MRLRNLFLLLIISLPLFAQNEKKSDDEAYSTIESLEIFTSVMRELDINYVDTLNHEQMLSHALNAMLYNLDPYTQFYPRSQNELMRQMKSGEYGGVGSVITYCDKATYFANPSVGKPAFNAGIRAGDKIVEIDGVKTDGKSVSEVSQMLRGKAGTTLKVKFHRFGEKKNRTVEIKRELIQYSSVPFYTAYDNVGYIRISEFVDHTASDFDRALKTLVDSAHIDRLIIDLRDNGGGLVEQAVMIASNFVPRNTTIATIKGLHAQYNFTYKTQREPHYPNMKLLFLVDDGTASASEILSGAMQDLDRAIVAGTRTYGKGLVQNIKQLPHESYLKMTTAKYYLPSGRCIQEMDYSSSKKTKYTPKEFKTAKGNIVYDGSGIQPDTTLSSDNQIDISYYLYKDQYYFKYANIFVHKYGSIAQPLNFHLSDAQYREFVEYVLAQKFTYTLESNKYMADLQKIVQSEGYGELTEELFEQLSATLQPNVENDLWRMREQVSQYLESEIVMRYYYNWGQSAYILHYDKWFQQAVAIIKG